MTGGGFGGCTVSLVRADAVRDVAEAVCSTYRLRTHVEPAWFTTRPAGGARILLQPATTDRDAVE
jgi:galactokinase